MTRKRLVFVFAAIALIMSGLVLMEVLTRSPKISIAPKENDSQGRGSGRKVLPNVTLTNAITKTAIQLQQFKGKVVFINFWAGWCDACVEEMPSIIALNNLLKDDGFVVVSVNFDDNPEKEVPLLIQALKLNFPVYTDKEEALASAFNVVALPLTVVADRDQNIVLTESGARDWASDSIIKEMRELLLKK